MSLSVREQRRLPEQQQAELRRRPRSLALIDLTSGRTAVLRQTLGEQRAVFFSNGCHPEKIVLLRRERGCYFNKGQLLFCNHPFILVLKFYESS